MKKVLFTMALAIIGVAALSSCKKDYVCTYPSGNILEGKQDYNDIPKHGVAGLKAGCEGAGGTWSAK